MSDGSGDRGELPARIRERMRDLQRSTNEIIDSASEVLVTELPDPVSISIRHSAPLPFPDAYLADQSMGFVIRYERLPSNYHIEIVQDGNRFQLGNLDFVHYVLNEFRPLIGNTKDSVYFRKIHSTWRRMLANRDPSAGASVQVVDEDEEDVTDVFTQWLGERPRAIAKALDQLEFRYLYNGVLQHSDHSFAQRFVDDYVSGELNYLLLKHVEVLGFVQDMLAPYHLLINNLAFPKRGGL